MGVILEIIQDDSSEVVEVPTNSADTIVITDTQDVTVVTEQTETVVIEQLAGMQGETGPQGIQGIAATITPGTTTTGPEGSDANVINVGTASDAVFDFVIPRGDTGPQGIQGIQGPQGPQGETGPANQLIVGTVTSSDTAPDVDIVGTAPNQTINFVLQRGPQGIQGEQGPQGIPGTGSVNSVNGDTGPDVIINTGSLGAEPTITAGTITQYWRGDKTFQTLDKAAVGLGNVDNTSDANKPISTATQTALNAKADLVGGLIPTSQLPPLAINETFVIGSEAAMLALTAQRGDMAIRTDTGTTFVLASDSPSTLADWKEISSPGDVLSVNGYTGTVNLTKSDIGLANVDNTSDANKPVSTATQTALNAKENTIATGTTSQFWRGDKTWQTLDKAAVGLANVDNTSDLAKPISTATQTALDGKAASVHSHAIGDLPVATSGTSNATQLVRADDLRLSDARTPTAHVHAATDITSGVIATARLGSGTADTTTFLRGDNTWQVLSDPTVPIQAAAPTGKADGTFWYDSDDVSADGYANITRVLHNGTAYPARPPAAVYVEWVGPVAPTAQITGDTWVNTA